MQHDINSIRPTSINHLIGQDHVREVVTVALDAAQQDGRRFDHALMVGPPGVGKTATSQVIAQEMATEFIEILGQSMKNVGDLNATLLSAKDRSIVFIDEAHQLDKNLQTALYLALDQRKILLPGGKGSSPVSLNLADFTLLLATTDEFQLLQPLRDRMKLVLRFDFYSPEDLEQIARHRSRGLGWEIDEQVFPEIAQRSRGTPRLALRLIESARRVARSEGEGVVTLAHLERACQLEQIDSLGLGPTEQKYLDILGGGSASRLNVIASMLGLPSRTVAEVVEPYLMRAGLMVKDDNGKRQLTALGREHLATRSHNHV